MYISIRKTGVCGLFYLFFKYRFHVFVPEVQMDIKCISIKFASHLKSSGSKAESNIHFMAFQWFNFDSWVASIKQAHL